MIAKTRLILEVLRSPCVRIECFGSEFHRHAFDTFTSPHPKYPLIRFTTFGVMLRQTGESFTGGRYETMRRKVRAAQRLGYTTHEISPDRHFDEIMAVNLSSAERQGRAMSDDYTNGGAVSRYNTYPGPWFGVFDKGGKLRAYCHTPIMGGCFFYSRILGDKSRLRDGIMHLMVRDTVIAMQTHLARFGYPEWAMYDTYVGGGAGLRQFKLSAGFAPARVRWHWADTTPA